MMDPKEKELYVACAQVLVDALGAGSPEDPDADPGGVLLNLVASKLGDLGAITYSVDPVTGGVASVDATPVFIAAEIVALSAIHALMAETWRDRATAIGLLRSEIEGLASDPLI